MLISLAPSWLLSSYLLFIPLSALRVPSIPRGSSGSGGSCGWQQRVWWALNIYKNYRKHDMRWPSWRRERLLPGISGFLSTLFICFKIFNLTPPTYLHQHYCSKSTGQQLEKTITILSCVVFSQTSTEMYKNGHVYTFFISFNRVTQVVQWCTNRILHGSSLGWLVLGWAVLDLSYLESTPGYPVMKTGSNPTLGVTHQASSGSSLHIPPQPQQPPCERPLGHPPQPPQPVETSSQAQSACISSSLFSSSLLSDSMEILVLT